MVVLPLALVALSLADPVLWELWKETFGHHFDTVDELIGYRNFQQNVRFIQEENGKGLSYKLGVNQFTGLRHEDFVAQHMGFRKPTSEDGATPNMGNHTWNGTPLPDAVDWVQQGAVTTVKDQGHCGSCWSFSTTGSIEGAYQIATGKLVSLSEQQFVDCDFGLPFPSLRNMGCHGGQMDLAFHWAKNQALCTEESYSYEAKKDECRSSSCTVGIPQGVVVGHKDVAWLPMWIPSPEINMKSAVAQQPVSVAIEADRPVFQNYASGVLKGLCGSGLDHGVLVVGYGTHPSDGKYWKVKNSWGATWGMEGFVLLERGTGLKKETGECGILKEPSYPIIGTPMIV